MEEQSVEGKVSGAWRSLLVDWFQVAIVISRYCKRAVSRTIVSGIDSLRDRTH